MEKVSNKANIGNAEFLLYFGSFLVSLAIFILVALGWESMSNAVKNFVLILSIFGFAGFGFIVYHHFNLKNAGHTFYALSSILFAISGIGFWNSGLNKVQGFDINLYFLLYSILILIFNALIYINIKRKRFLYLTIISVYIFFTSVAFILNSDDRFRVVIIGFLNFALYLLSNYAKEIKSDIYSFARVVNWILNLVIVTIFAFTGDVNGFSNRLIAIIPLLVPTVFIISEIIIDEVHIDFALEMLALQIKALLIGIAFRFDMNEMLIFFSILNIVLLLISEFLIDKEKRNLKLWNLFIVSISVLLLNLPLGTQIFALPDMLKIDLYAQILVLVISLIVLALPWYLRKNKSMLGFSLVYTIFIAVKLTILLKPDVDLNFIILILGIFSVFVVMIYSYVQLFFKKHEFIIIPVVFFSMLSYALTSLYSTDSLWIASTYIIIAFELIIISYFNNNSVTRVLALLSINMAFIFYLITKDFGFEYSLFYILCLNAFFSLIEWINKDITEKYKLISVSVTAKVLLILITLISISFNIADGIKDISYIVFMTTFFALLFSRNGVVRRLSGIPVVFIIWLFTIANSWDVQLFALPVTLYLITLGIFEYVKGRKDTGIVFES